MGMIDTIDQFNLVLKSLKTFMSTRGRLIGVSKTIIFHCRFIAIFRDHNLFRIRKWLF